MSPEMRRLQPGCSGYIDLYWNDLFSLRRCIDETMIGATNIEPKKLISIKEEPISFFEDNLLSFLYSRFVGEENASLPPQAKNEFDKETSPLMALWSIYFADLVQPNFAVHEKIEAVDSIISNP
jgi:hypothetical protein